jgi:hypothetical protein
MTNPHPCTDPAVGALQSCRADLICARYLAENAAAGLDGARATRARQLAEMITAAQAFCERLAFMLEADAHSSAHERVWLGA